MRHRNDLPPLQAFQGAKFAPKQAVGRGALMLCDATQARKFDLRSTKVSHAKVTRAEVFVELAIEKGTGLAAEKRALAIENDTAWDAKVLNWVELTKGF